MRFALRPSAASPSRAPRRRPRPRPIALALAAFAGLSAGALVGLSAAAVADALLFAARAHATETGALTPRPGPVAARPPLVGFAMTEGPEVRGPRGYYALCARAPQDCPAPRRSNGPQRIALDAAAWSLLNRVNRGANAAHRPMTDLEAFGASDLWRRPDGVADCEDYAIAKRAALIAYGVPAEALLIGVVEGREADYHAVLVVRTDRGDLVLDNLDPEIRTWTATDYVWVIRQSERDPARWVRITGAHAPKPAPSIGVSG